MKKLHSYLISFLFLLSLVLIFNSCGTTKELEGNWETNALIKDGVYQQILVSNMENTGFQGKLPEMEFEDMFFTVLMNAESYKIENDVLYLYAPSSNMELQLRKKVAR